MTLNILSDKLFKVKKNRFGQNNIKTFGIIELFARYHTYKYLNYSHLCYKIMSGASVKSCKSNF